MLTSTGNIAGSLGKSLINLGSKIGELFDSPLEEDAPRPSGSFFASKTNPNSRINNGINLSNITSRFTRVQTKDVPKVDVQPDVIVESFGDDSDSDYEYYSGNSDDDQSPDDTSALTNAPKVSTSTPAAAPLLLVSTYKTLEQSLTTNDSKEALKTAPEKIRIAASIDQQKNAAAQFYSSSSSSTPKKQVNEIAATIESADDGREKLPNFDLTERKFVKKADGGDGDMMIKSRAYEPGNIYFHPTHCQDRDRDGKNGRGVEKDRDANRSGNREKNRRADSDRDGEGDADYDRRRDRDRRERHDQHRSYRRLSNDGDHRKRTEHLHSHREQSSRDHGNNHELKSADGKKKSSLPKVIPSG